MTDKKLSDNEIISAFLWCRGDTSDKCRNCPLEDTAWCDEVLDEAILQLINRLKAENERLQKAIAVIDIMEDQHKYDLKKAKAEAVKEFAERLKEKAYPFPCAVGVEYAATIRAINDLVKEMTGDNDE